VDSCSIRAVFGGDQTGPNPTDRAKRGSKRHLICDGRGVPRNSPDRGESKRLARSPGARGCHSSATRRTRATAAAAGMRARRSRLRRGGDSPRSSGSPHRALASHAPHGAWEWPRPVALGRGAHVRVAQSVSSSARSLRQTDRHPRGLSLVGMRADLLAVPSKRWLSA
jgi:hypothetical protein